MERVGRVGSVAKMVRVVRVVGLPGTQRKKGRTHIQTDILLYYYIRCCELSPRKTGFRSVTNRGIGSI